MFWSITSFLIADLIGIYSYFLTVKLGWIEDENLFEAVAYDFPLIIISWDKVLHIIKF